MELDERGRRLWDSLMNQDPTLLEENNPQREIALSACRTADRVDVLEHWAADNEPMIQGRAAQSMHPAWAEVRQQALLLARLVAALRLPDLATGKKAAARSGVRAMNQPERLSPLERARARAAS
jgi:hypothetical protein